ncbi:dihydroneopterin triphosphate diphosphatase [Glaciecola sp. MF2-115]|uniref:dihydroneopterin triphosphate diphosphatase n=1 Tax=Glaciecola sp. MF2-115 TaxID=3384827 RepID=UPI0039A11218
MQLKRPESVLVVIRDEHNQVLIMQRDDDANFWQSVTGTIEQGESPLNAAYRELAEETGIVLPKEQHPIVDCRRINQFKIRSVWLHRYPSGTKFNNEYVFSVQVPSGSPITLTEHTDFSWTSKQDAMQRVWSDSNREAIAQFVPD